MMAQMNNPPIATDQLESKAIQEVKPNVALSDPRWFPTAFLFVSEGTPDLASHFVRRRATEINFRGTAMAQDRKTPGQREGGEHVNRS
jgi:hypothetical protein